MDILKSEYEFLDLSDVKESELGNLKCALSATSHGSHSNSTPSQHQNYQLQANVSSRPQNGEGTGREMSSASPARGGSAPPAAAPPPQPYVPPQHYSQPPPLQQQWSVAPPSNVYVGQVTANVNVHGYMGQYHYRPSVTQYQGGGERGGRPRRERRFKRPPSPPPSQPPPYTGYVTYPQYYQPAASGAPLYQLPVYQPMYVNPYHYAPYVEYPPVEDMSDKGPDEYPAEYVMEHEPVEVYYPQHYMAPHVYDGARPPPDAAACMEYLPHLYAAPPPPHMPPVPPTFVHLPMQPINQLNVHAKNFQVRQIENNKQFAPPVQLEMKPADSHPVPPKQPIVSAAGNSIDALPIKELKISSKPPVSPNHSGEVGIVPENVQIPLKAPAVQSNDKVASKPQLDGPKPAWVSSNTKIVENQIITKTLSPTPPQTGASAPAAIKPTKGPAPFINNKQIVKNTSNTPQPSSVIIQPQNMPSKAPFTSKLRKELPATKLDIGPPVEIDKSASSENAKNSTQPGKPGLPISITLHSPAPQINTKAPFGHARKLQQPAETPPTAAAPPPAPTASDFPPPPTPRNRVPSQPDTHPMPQPVVSQPPTTGKSWASLFSPNKVATTAIQPVAIRTVPIEEATPVVPAPVAPQATRPVAKVGPFDASPLQQASFPEKPTPPVPGPVLLATSISYSEKTSVNAQGSAQVIPAPKSIAPSLENKEVPVKETMPPVTMTPSPFADDPNSYRMGEFLSKYQLDNRTVSLMPRGLSNRSNFCYINAVLQALIACPPFYNMLKALPYQTRRGKSSTPIIDAMVELCYEFSPMSGAGRAGRSARGTDSGLPPATGLPLEAGAGQRVLRAVRPSAPPISEAKQEDAEEFLSCLLNGLNDEMYELIKLVEPEEPKDVVVPNGKIQQLPEEDDDDEWKVMGPKNKGSVERRLPAGRTPLADIFRGRTRSRLHRAAPDQHDITDCVQPFFTLQLDIERASSVKDALELVGGRDQVEGAAGGAVEAWQQASLEQLPVVLLLHLKCFHLDRDGLTAKINKNFEFPVDLKIDPKILSSKSKYQSKHRLYKLFAVVYHEGTEAIKGHYLTDTYHVGYNGWIRYDDANVALVTEAQVLKPKTPRMPYLLMYRRQDTMGTLHRPGAKPE